MLDYGKEGAGVIDNVYYKFNFKFPNKPLVIVFSNAGFITSINNTRDPDYSPWGYQYLLKKNVNILAFSSIEKLNWYRSPIFIKFLKNISAELQCFPLRLGYGGSMGGYAVGAFSELLNLDKILLLSPISTLNSKLIPWDERHIKYRIGLNWDSEYHDSANSTCEGVIVYDPLHSNDTKHAKRYQNLKHLHFSGVGHDPSPSLQFLGLLDPLINNLITGKIINEYFFYKKIKARRFLPRYYEWMLCKENIHLTPKRKLVIEKSHNKMLQMTKKYSYTDQLRDDAIKLEKTSIKAAYEIMKLAFQLRPDGPLIKKKIAEYQQLLDKN